MILRSNHKNFLTNFDESLRSQEEYTQYSLYCTLVSSVVSRQSSLDSFQLFIAVARVVSHFGDGSSNFEDIQQQPQVAESERDVCTSG